VLGEYSDCYGNDDCDGFAPNFPLIRTQRNQTAKFIQLLHNSSLCGYIVPLKFKFVNGFKKLGRKTYKKMIHSTKQYMTALIIPKALPDTSNQKAFL
jgi:hypothetical protein